MKLDRNSTLNGLGKYALLNLRRLRQDGQRVYWQAGGTNGILAVPNQYVEFGDSLHNEFFAIKLKDKYAQAALTAYATAAAEDDEEYAQEIRALAARSGPNHPLCKKPD